MHRIFVAALVLTAVGCGDMVGDTNDTGDTTESPASTGTTITTTTGTTTTGTNTTGTNTTGTNTTPTTNPLTIVGDYTDNFGTNHQITDATWTQSIPDVFMSTFHITRYDNTTRYVVAQNDASNGYDPNLYSRFDWHDDLAGNLYYCQSTFGAATEALALAGTPADSANLDSGCGGFSWSNLTP